MWNTTAFILLVPIVLVGGTATAQPSSKTLEQLAREGRDYYTAGEYAKAVSSYIEAYQLEPAAAVLYNIAFIYDRKLGEEKLAMSYLRRYVQAEDSDPAIVQRALERLDQLKALAAERVESAAREAEALRAGAAPVGVSVGPRPATGTSPWLWAGVGGAGLFAVGAIAGGLSLASQAKFGRSRELGEKKSFRTSAKLQALIGDALMGAGVVTVLISAGIGLFGGQPTAVSLDVRPTAGGSMVWVSGEI